MSTTQKQEQAYLDSVTESRHQKTIGTMLPEGKTIPEISANWQAAIAKSDHLGLVSNIKLEPIYVLFENHNLEHYNKQLKYRNLTLTKSDMEDMKQTLTDALLAWCRHQLTVCEGPAADVPLPGDFDISMDYDFVQVGLNNGRNVNFKPTVEELQGRISREDKSIKYRAALSKITCFISDGGTIEGIQFTLTDFYDGTTNVSPRYGRPGDSSTDINIDVENGNRVQDIKLYYTDGSNNAYVYGLAIKNPATNTWESCGRLEHKTKLYQLERNQYLLGFSGALWPDDSELVALAPIAGNITNYSINK